MAKIGVAFPNNWIELPELRELDNRMKKIGFWWQIAGFPHGSAVRLRRILAHQYHLEEPLCFPVVAQETGKQQV